MTELKRCPFCGIEGEACDVIRHGTQAYQCRYCGATATDQTHWETRPIEDELNARIAQLEAERDELQEKLDKRLYQLYMIDLAKTQNELDEWKADAERLIQLANFNNARAGEYFDLHEQLVKKYEVI